MTKQELAQLSYLNREIAMDRRRLLELQTAAVDTSARISGLPRPAGRTDRAAIAKAIADCTIILEEKICAAAAEYTRLTHYIAGVEDSMIRQILTLRHIDGLSWAAIAMRIGGGNTPDSVRMAHDRYIRHH